METTKPKAKASAARTVARRAPHAAASAAPLGASVVRFCIQGASAPSPAFEWTPTRLVAALQAGLPFREVQELQAALAVPAERLARLLGLSKATFHRRKGDAGTLSPAVSDRVVRYARLLGQACDVFENRVTARQWLNAPQVGLGGAVPLEFATSETGAREVENLLGRIEYGVYS